MNTGCQYRQNDEYAAPRPSAGVFDSPAIPLCLNTEWASHLDGLLEQLLCPSHWQGTETEVEAAIQQVQILMAKLADIQECPEARVHYIGEPFALFVQEAPAGALPMDGVQRLWADYPLLAEKIPGSWISGPYFTLPNMATRGLVGVGAGTGGFEVYAGETFGEAFHTLTVNEMPEHDHTVPLSASTSSGTAIYASANRLQQSTKATSKTGTGQPHNNMPPGLGAYWFIQAE